jgi:cell division protein FtsZ
MIRPISPKPSLFLEPARNEPMPQEVQSRTFIPPQPERIAVRAPRMPRVDELPIPAQNQIRAKRGMASDDHPEKRRMTLLQRLASVGLGRKDDAVDPPEESHPMPRQAPPSLDRPPQRPLHRPHESRGPDPVSDYAKRAPQGLDPLGRQTPVHNSGEEDQLDIPAFLRRQAN